MKWSSVRRSKYFDTEDQMAQDMEKLEAVTKRTWPVVMAWIGGISAVIGFFVTISGTLDRITKHRKHKAEYEARMTLAKTQASQGEYRASLASYGDLLKEDSTDQTVLKAQLDTAMQWVENFGVYVRQGQNEADVSAPALDQILPVLTAGLTRAKGTDAADIEAHLGWAHWLNAQMTQRESGSIADSDLQDALKTDPTNTYAHALTGFLQLKTGGDLQEAAKHFHLAVASGRARPFVRRLQLGALIYLDKPGSRAELVRVANDMRKNGEAMDAGSRNRILAFCFDPIVTRHNELIESLSAVPNDEARKTYDWLRVRESSDDAEDSENLQSEFIDANLLELSGKREESLAKYRDLHGKLGDGYSSVGKGVNEGIARLTSSAHKKSQ